MVIRIDTDKEIKVLHIEFVESSMSARVQVEKPELKVVNEESKEKRIGSVNTGYDGFSAYKPLDTSEQAPQITAADFSVPTIEDREPSVSSTMHESF